MIDEHQQEQACLYAAGVMDAADQARFEQEIAGNKDLARFTSELLDTGALALVALAPLHQPAPALRERILSAIAAPRAEEFPFNRLLSTSQEPVVITDSAGLVEWVSPAFVEMCGYELDEVRGKKPGRMLQGEKTDGQTVARLRTAIQNGTPCFEELVNYRKNGEAYWVAISLTPVLDAHRKPRCFVAFEQELSRAV